MVVAGAGTGLGMAWFADRSTAQLPQGTEGGHIDLAANDDVQCALRDWMAQRYGHVSYERVLSGAGLVDAYRFLSLPTRHADITPREINQAAHAGDATARAAIALFVDIFAAYAGNLALAFDPRGGIYLCGGLTAHLATWFDQGRFVQQFCAKGRMRPLLEQMPVRPNDDCLDLGCGYGPIGIAMAHQADFRLIGSAKTMIPSNKPVISICALWTSRPVWS